MSLPKIEIVPVEHKMVTIADIPMGHVFTCYYGSYKDVFFKASKGTIVCLKGESSFNHLAYSKKEYTDSHNAVDLGTFDEYIKNGTPSKLVPAYNLPYGTVVNFNGEICHITYCNSGNGQRLIQSLQNSLNNYMPTDTNLVEVIGTLKVTK